MMRKTEKKKKTKRKLISVGWRPIELSLLTQSIGEYAQWISVTYSPTHISTMHALGMWIWESFYGSCINRRNDIICNLSGYLLVSILSRLYEPSIHSIAQQQQIKFNQFVSASHIPKDSPFSYRYSIKVFCVWINLRTMCECCMWLVTRDSREEISIYSRNCMFNHRAGVSVW